MTVVIVLVSWPILFFLGLLTFMLIIIFPKQIRLLLYIFCRVSLFMHGIIIKEEGFFPQGGPFIFAMNHGSFIDYFITVVVMGYKKKWIVVYGKNLHKYPIFKTFLKRIGIGVDRKNKESKLEVSDLMREAIIAGFSIAIFPEGTRMRSYQIDEVLLNFKNGCFSVAIEFNTPIVPVVLLKPILYSAPDKILPFSPLRCITIKYCEPIVGEENCKILRDKVHSTMKDIISKAS